MPQKLNEELPRGVCQDPPLVPASRGKRNGSVGSTEATRYCFQDIQMSFKLRSTSHVVAVSRNTAALTAAPSGKSESSSGHIHDGRLPYWQVLEQLQRPTSYNTRVLQGHKYAWGRSLLGSGDILVVADADFVQNALRKEDALGITADFPDTFRRILGEQGLSMTSDSELHKQLRQMMAPYFTADAMQRLTPDILATVQKHMARWATDSATSPVDCYAVCKLLTFEIIVNQVMRLEMSDAEVDKYSKGFATMVAGLIPPAINLPILPFGRGMKARQQIVARVRQALHDPDLPSDSLPAKLRDDYGPDSDIAVDNMINILFAGHDTTSSALSFLFWQLSQHPEVISKIREEHKSVEQRFGADLSPSARSAMTYTSATVKETLRLARVIPGLMRKATKPIEGQGPAVDIPAGCPFLVATGAMSVMDPATRGDSEEFKPERYLDPQNAKALEANQLPFGSGQHYCLGSNLAITELTLAIMVIARTYPIRADDEVDWVDFPMLRPAKPFGIELQAI